MKTIELFSGTKSFSKISRSLGNDTLTIDNDQSLFPDVCTDIMDYEVTIENIDVLWASPPCQGFSVAAIGKNWNRDKTPKTDSARNAMMLVRRTMEIIDKKRPRYWFIENPRGMLRKMEWFDEWVKKNNGVRNTVSYCQYGDKRQKPTDIWTNCIDWKPRPMCRPGSSCHEPAPRGSRTGTQGLKNAVKRGEIPGDLFIEIFNTIYGKTTLGE